MRTAHDNEVFEETGNVTPERLKAMQHALRARARDARAASVMPGTHPQAAAALRGKANAYGESADLISSLLAGNGLRKPKWTIAKGTS